MQVSVLPDQHCCAQVMQSAVAAPTGLLYSNSVIVYQCYCNLHTVELAFTRVLPPVLAGPIVPTVENTQQQLNQQSAIPIY